MRTTLTLDDDVAARLEDLTRETGRSFKDTVNETLRRGLEARKKKLPRKRFRVEARRLGLLPGLSLDNIGDLLEQVEGPGYK